MFASNNYKAILLPLILFAALLVFLISVSWTQMDSRFLFWPQMNKLGNKKVVQSYDEIITRDMANYNWNTTLSFPEQLSNQSKTINIGIICTNIKSRFFELKVALDSLMLHRSCHVNFHFGVNAESREWVEAYFKLRSFSSTDVQFYSLEINNELVKNASESSSFRGGVAFLKINADQLFTTVDEMLLLDFDILVQGDICVAYSDVHNQLKEEQRMIMVTGEMGGWYDHNHGHQRKIGVDLPANFKGFWTGINTGVMFLDLHQMRTKQWTEAWIKELQSGRYSAGDYFALGEQSLMNAIAQDKPEIFGFMSYIFNFQINAFPMVDLQFALFEDITILHGSGGRFQLPDTRTLAHVAWLLHNPMHTGNIPAFIKSGEITIDNYKEKKVEIFWYVQRQMW